MMSFLTRTYNTITFLFCFCLSASALNITIMESQSFHPAQTMDLNWYNAALVLGHDANFETYDFLNDACNLKNTDILVVSSGLINLSDLQKTNIKEFVRFGGQLYIQSEYLFTHSGNIAFQYLVTELGGHFDWTGQGSGQQVPMYVQNPIRNSYNTVNQLSYFWYGTYGDGDSTIQPFLQHQGKSYGFIFESNNAVHGQIITSSDQDWIRNYSNPLLLENILKYLERQVHTGLLPAVSITSTAEESCAGEIVTFNAEILNYHPGVALQWTINGQPVNGETATVFQTADLQDGDVVECVLQLEKLCYTHQHVSNPILMAVIVPVASPELTIAVPGTEFCAGESILFTAVTNTGLSGLSNISYQWYVNSIAQNNSNNPIYTTSKLNNQDIVYCELSYTKTCTGAALARAPSITLTIHDMVEPTVQLTASDLSICEGTPVVFSTTGTHLGTAPTYVWFLDGNPLSANGSTLTLDNLQNGQEVSVAVNSNTPCATINMVNTQPISITVSPILTPSATIQTDENNICIGELARFVIDGNNLGLNPNYEWTVDGSVTGPNAPEFTTNTLQNGAEVSCRITVNGECLTSNLVEPEAISMQVNNLNTPLLEIDANAERACEGSSVSFTATGEYWGSAPVFQWLLNGEVVEGTEAELVIPDFQAGYAISCVLISNEACVTHAQVNTSAAPVAVMPLQAEVVEVTKEHCGKADGLVEVSVSGGFEPLQLEWNNGAIGSYLTDLSAGDYQLVVSDDLGCTVTVEATVATEVAPQILTVVTTPALCEQATGNAVVQLENGNTNYDYTWYNKDGVIVSNNDSEAILSHGIYSVVVSDDFGCESTTTFEIERHSPITVITGEDQEIRLGEKVSLDAYVNLPGDVSYQWLVDGLVTCNDCESPEVQPTESTVYTVIATTAYGCSASDEIEVTVLPNKDLYIPNVFSPNGDGSNDYFNVFGGDNLVSVVRMQIFDRWGAVVYEQKNISPNVEAEGWNGFYRGKVMDQGVYVYVVELEFLDGSVKLMHGDVSIF